MDKIVMKARDLNRIFLDRIVEKPEQVHKLMAIYVDHLLARMKEGVGVRASGIIVLQGNELVLELTAEWPDGGTLKSVKTWSREEYLEEETPFTYLLDLELEKLVKRKSNVT